MAKPSFARKRVLLMYDLADKLRARFSDVGPALVDCLLRQHDDGRPASVQHHDTAGGRRDEFCWVELGRLGRYMGSPRPSSFRSDLCFERLCATMSKIDSLGGLYAVGALRGSYIEHGTRTKVGAEIFRAPPLTAHGIEVRLCPSVQRGWTTFGAVQEMLPTLKDRRTKVFGEHMLTWPAASKSCKCGQEIHRGIGVRGACQEFSGLVGLHGVAFGECMRLGLLLRLAWPKSLPYSTCKAIPPVKLEASPSHANP